MQNNLYKKMHRINLVISEINSLYHEISIKLGMSDSIFMVMYSLYDNNGDCDLREIYKQSGISKQTINSAIRKLEQDEIIYLKNKNGREKTVFFTEKGRKYADETIARLVAVEYNVFSEFSEEEINLYIEFNERFVAGLKEKIKELG